MPGDLILLHMCTIIEDHDIWFLKYKVGQTWICFILGHFVPFHLRDNPENQNFEKLKKKSGDIILSLYTVTEIQHMTDLIFIFLFLLILPFYPPITRKMKIFTKWKQCLDISFYTCVQKIMITWCTVPEIWYTKAGWTDGPSDRWTVFSTINYLLKVSAPKYGLWLYSSQI